MERNQKSIGLLFQCVRIVYFVPYVRPEVKEQEEKEWEKDDDEEEDSE